MGTSKPSKEENIELITKRAKNFLRAYKIIIGIKNNIENTKKDDKLKVFLISTKSIPNFIGIFKKYKNFLDNINDIQEIENNIKTELSSYELGNVIKIYSDYGICKTILDKNNQIENEFIIVNEEIINILQIKDSKNKYVEITICKNMESKKIKFPISLKIISFTEKKESCLYQFGQLKKENTNKNGNQAINTKLIIDNMLGNIIFKNPMQKSYNNMKINEIENINYIHKNNNLKKSTSSEYSNNFSIRNLIFSPSVVGMLKEYENKKKSKNYIKNTLDLFPLIYCLSNISLLSNYFRTNKNKFLSISKNDTKFKISKAISEIIYELSGDKNFKNVTNFDVFQEILGNNEENYKSKNLFINLYNQMHNELNTKNINSGANGETPSINSDKTNLEMELVECRDIYDKRNKSIITDIFNFEEIKMNQCINCKIITYNCGIIHYLEFNLDDVLNYKLNNNFVNIENINIKDCFDYLVYPNKNNYFCNKCNNQSLCNNFAILNSLPEILTVILDRKNEFENGIEFGLNFIIDLKNYLYKWGNIQEDNTKYELIGMLTYFRKGNGSDHTAIYRAEIDKKWYFFKNTNPENLDNISDSYLGMPYLLFYQRIK